MYSSLVRTAARQAHRALVIDLCRIERRHAGLTARLGADDAPEVLPRLLAVTGTREGILTEIDEVLHALAELDAGQASRLPRAA